MTAKEAWNSMMQGKPVRYKSWPENNFIYFDKKEYKIKNSYGIETIFYVSDIVEDAWEVYEEDERSNIMNFKEAWNSMMAGKKVRNVVWVKDAYIYYDKKSLTIKDNNNNSQSAIIFDDYFSNNEWELYKEDERSNIMNFEEARRKLLEGKKVRCVDWAKNAYVYFDYKNLLVKDENGNIQSYGIVKWKNHEWELYEELKKVFKVFISQPMRGKDKCEIYGVRNKIKEAVEKKYSKKYQIEYLNENLWERPKDWTRIQHLGCSIMNMHDADVVVFAPDWIKAHGCCVEHEVAYRYDKKLYTCEEQPNGEYILY